MKNLWNNLKENIMNRFKRAWKAFMANTDSNYHFHLDREWEALGWPKDDEDDMQTWIYDHLKEMLITWHGKGHSGSSAPYTIALLKKVLMFEPLSPLTGEDHEWIEVDGKGLKQNNRCSHVFMRPDGTAYDLDGIVWEDADGITFTSPESVVDIEFPYIPTTKYRPKSEMVKENE